MSVAVNSGAVPGFVLELAAAYAKAGIGPGKNGDSLPTGGTVTTDGAYTVHVFTASGTLIVPAGVTVPAATVLVVGGGGGGSRGGGGAGGYLTGPQVLSGSMSVAVGSGGAGQLSASTVGDNGQDSVFGAYTAKGGGGGGQDSNGVAGGSGGGGGASGGAVRSGGAATPAGQGNAGGSSGSTASPYPGGGGGGAGAVGAAGAGSVGGHGGAGLYTDIIKAGTSVGYGGGGGGCTWLAGTPGTASEGGGAGKSYSTGNGLPGTANTGGGGGGAGNGSSQVGGTGGSGIVVIRYLTASCYTADWNDDSGNGNDGALANFAGTTSSGWAGSGTSADPYRCVMDGVDDIITIPDAVAMHVSTGDFTIEMWTDALNPVTGYAVNGLCYKGVHDTPSSSDLAIQMTVQGIGGAGKGTLRSFVGVGAATGDPVGTTYDFTGRCHIVLTRTSGVCQTYFNDAVIGASFTNAADLSAIVGRWNIGPNSIQNHPLNGGVAVFRQYPFALSLAQIKQNGAAGIPVGGQGSGALSTAGAQSGATPVVQTPPLWIDGAWTRVGVVASMVDSWVQEAIVMHEDDLWEMWAHAGSGENYNYLTAPAREGPWTWYSGNPVVSGAWQGDVIKVGSTYHMFAARGDIGTIPYRHDHLISTNKIDWTVYASDILPLGPAGAFDDWGIFNTRVLVDDDGTCYLYYDARRQYDAFYTVGLAVAPDINSPFVKYVGNPVLGSPLVCTGRAKVLHINGGYYMWEHGEVATSPSRAITLPTDAFRAYAPSPYGPWVVDPVARLVRTGSDEGEGMPYGQIADCHVMVDGDTLLMFYTANSNGSGVGPTNGPSVIKLATAPLITEAGAAEVAGVYISPYVDTGPIALVLPGVPQIEVESVAAAGPIPIPPGISGFSTAQDVILTPPGGTPVHLGTSVRNLVTSRARQYGFEKCTFELPQYDVRQFYTELQVMTDVLVMRDGIVAFHGRISDPGMTTTDSDICRKVSCRGYWDGLSDNECEHAMYADSDPTAWGAPTKAPVHDWGMSANSPTDTPPGLVAQAKWGTTYPADAYGVLCYKLFGGLPSPLRIAGMEATWHWNGAIDPARLVTGQVPTYNLFPDPRALSASSHWQVDGSIGIAKDVKFYGSDSGGFSFRWDSDVFGTLPDGFSYWAFSISLPSDVQASIAAGGDPTIRFMCSTAGNGGTDAAVLVARNRAGGSYASALLCDLPASDDWVDCSGAMEVPADTTEIELLVGVGVGTSGWRDVASIMLTNGISSLVYHDGFDEGWEWTGTANQSASRQTDLTVSELVIDNNTAGCLIMAILFGSPDPAGSAKKGVFEQPMYVWGKRKLDHGSLSATCDAPALGLCIMHNGADVSLTFNAPTTGATPDPYGLTIDTLTVYACAGMGSDGIGVLDVLRSIALKHTPRVDFPDASSLKAKQLVFNDATTDAATFSQVDALLNWEYGFHENGTLYYYDPARIAADPAHVFVIPYAEGLCDLIPTQSDDLCNGVEVSWTHTDGTPDCILVTRDSPWLPSDVQKYHSVAIPTADGSDKVDATALANAYLDEHVTPQVTGTVKITASDVKDARGAVRSPLAICEGDYVLITDMPMRERQGKLLVARSTVDHNALTVTLEVGMNRRKLDSLLARFNAKVVRK